MKTKLLLSIILICGCTSLGTKLDEISQSPKVEEDSILISFKKHNGTYGKGKVEARFKVDLDKIDTLILAEENCDRIQFNTIAYTKNKNMIYPPNPFAPSNRIKFEIIDPDSVCIQLYNKKGIRIAELFRNMLDVGKYHLVIVSPIKYRAQRDIYKISIGNECWLWQVYK